MIAGSIRLSVNMDTLWASVPNKSKLQMLLRKSVIENAENTCPEEVETVFIFSVLISMSITERGRHCVIIRFGLNYLRGRCAVSTTCYSCNTDSSKETWYSIW